MKHTIWHSLLLSLFLFFGVALAQPKNEVTVKDLLEQENVEQTHSQDKSLNTFIGWDMLGRETPRSSMQGFLTAARQSDYEQAANYLDFRNLPFKVEEAHKAEIARQLHVSLDRALWVDIDGLSNDPL
ncbi:MAG: mechanosensitive ion channel family protein, partial [Pseudomonadota bacterium]|nr:mechanosensitive ion channel family protein [Pseudomonadota bacterium]